jgi:hypothetical protein
MAKFNETAVMRYLETPLKKSEKNIFYEAYRCH